MPLRSVGLLHAARILLEETAVRVKLVTGPGASGDGEGDGEGDGDSDDVVSSTDDTDNVIPSSDIEVTSDDDKGVSTAVIVGAIKTENDEESLDETDDVMMDGDGVSTADIDELVVDNDEEFSADIDDVTADEDGVNATGSDVILDDMSMKDTDDSMVDNDKELSLDINNVVADGDGMSINDWVEAKLGRVASTDGISAEDDEAAPDEAAPDDTDGVMTNSDDVSAVGTDDSVVNGNESAEDVDETMSDGDDIAVVIEGISCKTDDVDVSSDIVIVSIAFIAGELVIAGVNISVDSDADESLL